MAVQAALSLGSNFLNGTSSDTDNTGRKHVILTGSWFLTTHGRTWEGDHVYTKLSKTLLYSLSHLLIERFSRGSL